MDNPLKKLVQDELEQITVKISTSPKSTGFKGTGFFITKEGYILTAWHCIQEAVSSLESDIFIESEAGDKFLGQLEKEKSIEDLDIAVIKIPDRIDYCVPLGRIPKKCRGDEVISVGYPGIHKNKAGIGVFSGNITRFVDYDIEVEGAIQGQGQSGGLLYHYATHRIVGVVKKIYNEDILRSAGLAARVDFLFSKWGELPDINEEIAKDWDERLDKCPKSSQPIEKQQDIAIDVPTSNTLSSIDLHNRLKKINSAMFNDICFYLQEKYDYDLSFIERSGAPAEVARQLVLFLKQYPQGVIHLQQELQDKRLL